MTEIIRHSSSTVLKADFSFIERLSHENYVGYGTYCKGLEDCLSKKFLREGVVLTGSAEGGVELALHHLHNQSPIKNEVVVSAYVCPAVVNAILARGLKPIFADLAEGSLNLSIDDVFKHRISDKTLAIICTHMGGYPDDLLGVMESNIPVISDCAQAIGAKISGKSVLSYGQMSVTSFGPTKFMTSGVGGALLCEGKDELNLKRLATSELSVDEYKESGFIPTIGQHVSDLNAGLALAQLDHVEDFVEKRMTIAKQYDEALDGVPNIELPKKLRGAHPNYFRYYFFSDYSDEWQQHLQFLGVDARSSISHVMTDYFNVESTRPCLAEQAKRVVSIPIYPSLTEKQIIRVIEALQSIATKIPKGVR